MIFVNINRAAPRRGLSHLALIVVLMTGCAIGPDFKRPRTKMAEQWMAAGQKQIIGKPANPIDWWKVFNDPLLDSLIAQAHDRNLTLQAAALRIVQARTLKFGAVWSEFPAIHGPSGSYTKTYYSQNSDVAGQIEDGSIRVLADGKDVPQPRKDRITLPTFTLPLPTGPVTSPLIEVTSPEISYVDSVKVYQAGFDALWELDVWGQKRRAIEAAGANYHAALAEHDGVLVSLAAEVAALYIGIRTLDERLRAARDNVALLEQFLAAAEGRAREAQVTELDVQMARTMLADARSAIPALESVRRVAGHALCVLLARPPQDLPPELSGPRQIPEAPLEVAVGIPADLLRRRPDVRRAEFAAWSHCARIGAAKGNLLPSFSLLGSIGLASSNTGNFFESDSFRGSYGGTFNWNPFMYPFIIETVRLQDAKFQEALAVYKEMVLRAAAEVESASARFVGVQDELKALAESAEASRRAAGLALDQYRAGTLQYPGAVEALQYRVRQEDRAIQVRGEVALSLVALYKALGGGWQLSRDKELLPDDVRDQMRERTDWWTFTGKRALEPKEFKKPDKQK